MGICFGECIKTNNKNITINDFSKVTIPKGYEVIKLATYNVNIKKAINLSHRIEEIISYLSSSYKNKEIDILCIQGIHDSSSANMLIKAIRKYAENNRLELYFAPTFDNIPSTSVGLSKKNFSYDDKYCQKKIAISTVDDINDVIESLIFKKKIFGQNTNDEESSEGSSEGSSEESGEESSEEENEGESKGESKGENKDNKNISNSPSPFVNQLHEIQVTPASLFKIRSINIKVENKPDPLKNLRTQSTDSKLLKTNRFEKRSKQEAKKIQIQNIIISKFPIVKALYSELNKSSKLENTLGPRSMIGANISIHGNIISVYNTRLNKDIKVAHLVTKNVREKEIITLFDTIQKNKEDLLCNRFDKYVRTNVHFLTGTLNIHEMIEDENNEEFDNFIQMHHCIDIYRYMCDNDKDKGYTNTTKKRLDYIFYLLTDDIYQETSPYYTQFQKMESTKDLFQFIFEKYKLYFLDICIRSDIYTSQESTNFPIECVFMLDKQNH